MSGNDPHTGQTMTNQSCMYSIPSHVGGYCECSDNIPRFITPGHGSLNCNFKCGQEPDERALEGAWSTYQMKRMASGIIGAQAASTSHLTLTYIMALGGVVVAIVVMVILMSLKKRHSDMKEMQALRERLLVK